MRKGNRKRTVLFLVLCMALSMCMAIPAKAEEGKNNLVLVNDFDWGEDGIPALKAEPEELSESGACPTADTTIYLGYKEGDTTQGVTSKDKIQIQYQETKEEAQQEPTEGQVEVEKVPDAEDGIFKFNFHKVGIYTITVEGVEGEVTVSVDFPAVGIYTQGEMTEDNYTESLDYEGGQPQTYYIIAKEDVTACTIEKEWEDGTIDLAVNGGAYEPGTEISLTKETPVPLVIEGTSAGNCGFLIKVKDDVVAGFGVSEKMTGLLASAWIDWPEGEKPHLNEQAELGKTIWADLNGAVCYFGYKETEDATEVTNIPADKLSVTFDGKDAVETGVAECKKLSDNEELTEFVFNKVGTYTITAEGVKGKVTIYVDYPRVGIYTDKKMAEDNYAKFLNYEGGQPQTYYIIAKEDIACTIENDWVDGTIALAVDGEAYTLGDEITLTEGTPVPLAIEGASAGNGRFLIKVGDEEVSSFEVSEKMTGLLASDWIDWPEEEKPHLNKDAELGKTIWADLSGAVCYFGYKETEDAEVEKITANDLSVYLGGKDAVATGAAKCFPNSNNADLTEFVFYKAGDYKVYKKGEGETSFVQIHVEIPAIGFYSAPQATEENHLKNIMYGGEWKQIYVVPTVKEGWKDFTYTIELDRSDGDFEAYIDDSKSRKRIVKNTEEEILSAQFSGTDPVTVTFLNNLRISSDFGLKIVANFTNENGEPGYREASIGSQYPFVGSDLEEEEGNLPGFSGMFITKETYEKLGKPGWQNDDQYWVHGTSYQDVIDKLVQYAEEGTPVTFYNTSDSADTRQRIFENTGYMWINTAYSPYKEEYKANGEAPQYVTTPDINGIYVEAGEQPCYVEVAEGDYRKVQCWDDSTGTTQYYTCDGDTEGEFFELKEDQWTFSLKTKDSEKIVLTREELKTKGLSERDAWQQFPIPQMHLDATIDVRMDCTWLDDNRGDNDPHACIGLYPDSDNKIEIMEPGYYDDDGIFHEMTIADDGKGVVSSKDLNSKDPIIKITAKDWEHKIGEDPEVHTVKIQVVPLTTETKSTVNSGEGDFAITNPRISAGESGYKLREKLQIEDALKLQGDSDDAVKVLRKQIIDGETPLSVNLDVTALDETATGQEKDIAAIEKQIDKNAKVQYMDLELGCQLGKETNQKTKNITETADPVTIQMELKATDAKNVSVYRYHNGEVEKLEGVKFDAKTKELSFGTDKFSVYAVTYEQNEATPPAGSTEKPQQPTTQQPTTQQPAEPKKNEKKTVDGKTYTVTGTTDGKRTVTYDGDKKASKVTLKSTVKINDKTYTVTAIADNAFSGNKKLTSVSLPSTITKIGNNAFKNCSKLSKITVPGNVKTIGKNAFYGCKKISKVSFKGTAITKIGDGAFRKCSALKSVTIPKNVTEIGKDAFRDCKKLKTVTIKGTKLKKIGKNAFKSISKKATIKVPKKKKTAYKKLLKKVKYKGRVK